MVNDQGIPTIDKRFLGVFMLIASQTNWINELLPQDGSEPDYSKTDLTIYANVEADIQKKFYDAFSKTDAPSATLAALLTELADPTTTKTMREVHRKLFQVAALAVSKATPSYTPPPCPKTVTLQSIVNAIKNAPES
jgi:hypothetical protein